MASVKLFNVAEVAEILQCNQNFVHELRKSGLLKFMKLGRYKCREETLAEFLAKYDGMDITNPYQVKELVIDEVKVDGN